MNRSRGVLGVTFECGDRSTTIPTFHVHRDFRSRSSVRISPRVITPGGLRPPVKGSQSASRSEICYLRYRGSCAFASKPPGVFTGGEMTQVHRSGGQYAACSGENFRRQITVPHY